MAKGKSQARVLVALAIGAIALKPNDLIEAEEALIKVYKKEGALDDSKAAVDYCKNELKAKPIQVTDPAVEAKALAEEELAAKKLADEKAAAITQLEADIENLNQELSKADEKDKPAIADKIDAALAELAKLEEAA